ncbi:MAG: hypothetical protein WC979_05970 [Candidatus Pacearchaeota archaeon]
MKLETITNTFGALIAAGALVFANPGYADAKITPITRPNGTIIKIIDTEQPERVLYPIIFCDKCRVYHPDKNKRKVELQFQTKSGKIVDYLKSDQEDLTMQPSQVVPNNPTRQSQQSNGRYNFPLSPFVPNTPFTNPFNLPFVPSYSGKNAQKPHTNNKYGPANTNNSSKPVQTKSNKK